MTLHTHTLHTLHTCDFYCQIENTTDSRLFILFCVWLPCWRVCLLLLSYMYKCMLDFDSFDDHFRLQLPYLAYIHGIQVDPLQQKFGASLSHISPSALSKLTWQWEKHFTVHVIILLNNSWHVLCRRVLDLVYCRLMWNSSLITQTTGFQ